MTIQKGLIGKEDISWGTSTFTRKNRSGQDMSLSQIYASSIPILDADNKFTGTNIETALTECMTREENGSSVKILTNKSGADRSAGDVVIIDTTNSNSFTTTTSIGNYLAIGVVIDSIANNGTGRVATSGYVSILRLDIAASVGNYIKTSTTAGKGTPTALVGSGVFAIALSAGTLVSAVIFGGALKTGSSSGLDADTVDGYEVGNTTGIIPLSNGTVCTNLNADKVDGLHAGAVVSGFTRSITTFIESIDGAVNTALTESSLTAGVTKTVGKTGSGADIIWTPLDSVPSTATAIILKINNVVDITSTAGGVYSYNQYVYGSKGDTAVVANINQQISQVLVKDNAAIAGELLAGNTINQVIIPITSTGIIKLRRSITAVNATVASVGVNIYLCGWLE